MTARWPCSVIATCCILAVAPPISSAASAWVLWSYVTKEGGVPWSTPVLRDILTTHDTKALCEADLNKRLSTAVASGNVRRWDDNLNRNTVVQPSGLVVTLQCVPDTIDPRGPKGK